MKRALRTMASLAVLLTLAWVTAWLSRLGTGAPAREADPLGNPSPHLPEGLLGSGAAVGLLLLGAWMAGRLVNRLRIAKVTGYLLFGILVGPSLLGLVTREETSYLALVNDLAISLIALTAGGEIRLSFLKSTWRRVATITGAEMTAVLLGVLPLALLVVPPMLDFDPAAALRVKVSILIAALAISNSPAVLIAVITELRARGDMARTALAVTVLKDICLVVLFTIALAITVAAATASDGDTEGGLGSTIVNLGVHLLGSLVVGVVVGLLMAWYARAVRVHMPVFVVFACFGIALLSEAMRLEALLVAVVAGMVMENAFGELSEAFFEHVEELSPPVYCLFFAVAGLKLDLDTVASLWHWALLLVAVRFVAVWAGTTLACRVSASPPTTTRWLWTAFIPQAGVSLALATIAGRSLADTEFGPKLFDFFVAVIAMNELVGPVLLRLGLERAGEVDPGPGESRSHGL